MSKGGNNNRENLDKLRHSCAHLLAAAVLDLWPKTKRTIGPPIEDGFYYDFDFGDAELREEDLPKIEKKMHEILKTWKSFERKEVGPVEARKEFKGNEYKLELIDEFSKESKKLTLYRSGSYTDLCKGGHVENPSKEIGAFKLTKIAGAYWRGNEKNKMLTRIYGTCFSTQKELDEYMNRIAEAEKRDHKKLGKELKLFTFSNLVGPGLPLILPAGNIIKTELEKFVREEKEKRDYSFVSIPHIAKTELYKKSGHLGKYDAMMPIMIDQEKNEFVMKAMNCPHHFEIYNSEQHSYRDLPLRIAETTTVYRNEKSGELSGLARVKSITQDDTHHFVTHDQIESEINMILGLMEKVYSTFGLNDYNVQISIRDPKNPKKYFGDDKLWKRSEEILVKAVKKWGRPYVVEEGEAAFYGPKIDIMVKDSLGRKWQLTTVQLDFNQPENFDMKYAGEDGKEHRPAVLHVAILGAIERFMGILIEHFSGAFPVWLSPMQVMILPISEKFAKSAEKTYEKLKKLMPNVRIKTDSGNEPISKRIRDAQLKKIPYMLVVGEREENAGTANVRLRNGEQLGELKLEKIAERINEKISKKSLEL